MQSQVRVQLIQPTTSVGVGVVSTSVCQGCEAVTQEVLANGHQSGMLRLVWARAALLFALLSAA